MKEPCLFSFKLLESLTAVTVISHVEKMQIGRVTDGPRPKAELEQESDSFLLRLSRCISATETWHLGSFRAVPLPRHPIPWPVGFVDSTSAASWTNGDF